LLYFLYGPETYRLQQKAREIEQQYLAVNQAVLNLEKFDAQNIGFTDFWQALSQRSMFVQKKLFFVENVFNVVQFASQFAKKTKEIAQSSDIVVVLEKRDLSAKNPLFKILLKQVRVQEFKKLKGQPLKTWIREELVQSKARIDESALNVLILFADDDLWRLSNELKKLASYSKNICEEDVLLLVRPKIESEIFRTIDSLAERDKPRALHFLHKHLNKDESPFYVFSMFVYQFRNLLSVKSALGEFSRLKKIGLHPFVLKKTSLQASRFSLAELKNIYQKIFKMDLAIKTGKISANNGLRMLVAEI